MNKCVSNPIKSDIKDLAQKFFSKADGLRAESKYKEATKEYLNSIMVKRNNPKAYFGLGLAYKELNNYKKSVSALKKAAELSPFDSEIFAELGISEIINGNFADAIKGGELHKEDFVQMFGCNEQLEHKGNNYDTPEATIYAMAAEEQI